MITVEGKWYDGKRSVQTSVVLKAFDNGAIQIKLADTGEIIVRQNKFRASISDRLADTPRFLTFSETINI